MCGTHDNYVSRLAVSALLRYKWWLTYYLLWYITCYYGSLSAPGQKSKCSLLVESECCQDELHEEMFCIGNVVERYSAQISTAHLCQPNAASANYTTSWDDTGRPWVAHSMTLDWCRKASLLLCTFPFEFKYRMHTNFCGMHISRMPCEWGFSRLYFC